MEFLVNFSTWFKALPASGKLSLMLVVVGAITAGILLRSEIQTSGYQYLYTNLSMTDTNAIAERLQGMAVPAQVRGDAVLVPGNRVLELRNMLASEGLPRGGGTGFEIFDKKNFGATEFEQRINYVRAIQGELARTISAIDGVESTRVHIVIPERRLFEQDMESPRASIALSLHKGRRLSNAQVSGIVHLVVTSVEGLTEDGINVIDQNGNVLFKATGQDGSSLSGRHLELKRNYEGGIERRLIETLERVVGPGGVSVNVSAQMNFSQVERTVESFDPESRVAISEQTINDQSSGSSGAAGGAPGAAANIPGGEGGSTAGRSETTRRQESSATYAISKTVQRILEPVGQVQRLSVAVLVDGTYSVPEGAEEGAEAQYVARSPEELQRIEELVRRAVGFNADRGDEVRVDNLQFRRIEMEVPGQEEFVSATNSSRWMMYLVDNAKVMGIILIAGILFLMLIKLINSYAPPMEVAYAHLIGENAGSLAKSLPSGAQVNIVQRDDKAAVDKAEKLIEEAQMAANQAAEQRAKEAQYMMEAPATSEEKLRLQAAKGQTEKLIAANVDEAVSVIRSWMGED